MPAFMIFIDVSVAAANGGCFTLDDLQVPSGSALIVNLLTLGTTSENLLQNQSSSSRDAFDFAFSIAIQGVSSLDLYDLFACTVLSRKTE